jgi:hypothetical protein
MIQCKSVAFIGLLFAGCSPITQNGGKGGVGGSDLGGDAAALADLGNGGTSALSIAPNPATVDVLIQNGVVSTTPLTFVATVRSGAGAGATVPAGWQLDRPELGDLVAASGVFTASGVNAGVAHVTATYGALSATALLNVHVHSVNIGATPSSGTGPQAPDPVTHQPPPGGFNGVGGVPLGGPPPQPVVTLLGGPGTTSAAFTWLYPYDQTVWPRGFLPPLLQWTVPANYHVSAIYVHLKQINFEFEGYYAGTDLVNSPVDAAAWRQATDGNGGDPLLVELKISDGSTVLGPLSEHWTIAPSPLRGTLYYNTYNSKLNPGTTNGSDGNGAVLSISPGGFQPALAIAALKGQCHVCHEVSSDGSTLFTVINNSYNGAMFDLRQSPAAQIGTYSNGEFTYSGVYPNGSLVLAGSREDFWAYQGNSTLIGRSSVAALGSTGFTSIVTRAITPSFSPDGLHIAFNFWEGPGANGVSAGGGRTLAVMDFDCGALPTSLACAMPPYGFNNLRVLYSDPTNNHYVGWPSFTPDSKMVVFQDTVTACADSGSGGSVLNTRTPAQAELWLADIPDAQTGKKRFSPMRLCAANGYMSDCQTSYLPTNANNHLDDAQLNFEPNVTPIASGGYFWVVFTSRRLYGNVAVTEPYTPYQNGPPATSPPTKKLWITAIDPNPTPGKDPSHPAFYLPGQELGSGNMRGFWVNEPCRAKGTSCTTGDECCSGYCVGPANNMICGDKPAGCVQEFGKCTSDGDCCGNHTLSCIGGICTRNGIG